MKVNINTRPNMVIGSGTPQRADLWGTYILLGLMRRIWRMLECGVVREDRKGGPSLIRMTAHCFLSVHIYLLIPCMPLRVCRFRGEKGKTR